MGGLLVQRNQSIEDWSTAHNPFYSTADWNGHRADLLSLIPFALLVLWLYRVGRRVSALAKAEAAPPRRQ